MKHRFLERKIKGFANYRRLQILELLNKEPELSVADISEKLSAGFTSVSAHINKMAIAGLVLKRHDGIFVRHKLTPFAKFTLKFVKDIK